MRSYESFGFHVRLFFAFQQPAGNWTVRDALPEVIEHETRRMAARVAWSRYFDDVDVFLCPVELHAGASP